MPVRVEITDSSPAHVLLRWPDETLPAMEDGGWYEKAAVGPLVEGGAPWVGLSFETERRDGDPLRPLLQPDADRHGGLADPPPDPAPDAA